MATGTDIPVTVTDEAREWIAGVGMQREFETMLEHARQTLPGLRAIEVTLEHDPSGAVPPQIVIWPYREVPGPDGDSADSDWAKWVVETFPPEVCLNFVLVSIYGAPDHGR